uniref:Pacifastin domain-containing protein n=1 Tax=Acanthochromis polyacanthus TaxID=80966 RepID=A0A3Q1GD47_9TELE
MQKYLTLALLLCALLSLSDAFCYIKLPTLGMTHCQDDVDKTWHAVGSSWRNSECMDCSCSGCLHKKDDPTVLCTNYAQIGK